MEQYANDSNTLLDGAINNSVTSITVDDTASFPQSGDFRIKIDDEYMLVTSVSPTSFTVTRGIEGSTAASHSDNAVIKLVLTAGSLLALISNGLISDTLANKPTADLSGRLFIPTDAEFIERDNGSTWDILANSFFKTTPPAVADFTWVQQGTAAASDEQGIILSKVGTGTGGANFGHSMLSKAPPGTSPWTVTIGLSAAVPLGNFSEVGMTIRDSGTDRRVSFGISETGAISIALWTTYNNYSAHSLNRAYIFFSDYVFLRIKESGSNYLYEASQNGYDWVTLITAAKTAWLASTTDIGLYIYNTKSSSLPAKVAHIFHYKEDF